MHEFFKIGDDGGDGGLLEHDFGDPDAIGVVIFTPREGAEILFVPGEEIFVVLLRN